MRTTDPGDAALVELLLAEVRRPAVKQVWASLAAQAGQKGWPAGRFLVALAKTRLPSTAAAGSNAISPKPGYHPTRPWIPSSRRFRR